MIENLKKLLNNAYTPYSNYQVACIVKTKSGQEYIGVNVENASLKSGLCAEQVAIGSALSEGVTRKDITEVHLLGSKGSTCLPCFLCRQLFVEFLNEETIIFCYNNKGETEKYTINDLCPHPFKLEGEEK